jgi:hypothetical protein
MGIRWLGGFVSLAILLGSLRVCIKEEENKKNTNSGKKREEKREKTTQAVKATPHINSGKEATWFDTSACSS